MRPVVESLRDIKKQLTGATKSITDKITTLRNDITTTRREILEAENGPLPPEDLVAAMREWLHGHLDYYQRDYGALVPHSMRENPRAPGGKDEILIALLLREVLDQAIPAFVERLGNYPAGPPLAKRPALVARLKEKLAKLEAEEEEFIDDAAAAGVVIAHRDDVVQRRQNEARQRELEEQRIADRRRRQEQLDQAHAQRPRFVRSSYIEEQAARRPFES